MSTDPWRRVLKAKFFDLENAIRRLAGGIRYPAQARSGEGLSIMASCGESDEDVNHGVPRAGQRSQRARLGRRHVPGDVAPGGLHAAPLDSVVDWTSSNRCMAAGTWMSSPDPTRTGMISNRISSTRPAWIRVFVRRASRRALQPAWGPGSRRSLSASIEGSPRTMETFPHSARESVCEKTYFGMASGREAKTP